MFLLCFALTAVLSYLIGGINGAIITSKYIYKKDIRQYGSGNPGLTNFFRVFGKGGVALLLLIDILKTAVPVYLGGIIFDGMMGKLLLGREFAGLFVLIGHAFPAYYGFKGGKTVLATGVMLIIIDWRVAALGWGVFLLIFLITRYVSLGAIIGVTAYPVAVFAFKLGGTAEFVIALISAAFLIWRHKDNIKRLARGEEPKLRFKKS